MASGAAVSLFGTAVTLIVLLLHVKDFGPYAVVGVLVAEFVPVVCGEEGSARGYSWLAFGRGAGMLAGSAAGGLLVAALGTRDALLVDAGTYFAQAAMLSFVRAERDPRGRERRQERGAATAGLRLPAGDPVLRVATACLAVACVGVMFADVANVFHVTEVLGGGAATLGLLHACWMLGVLVGARVAVRLVGQRALLLGLGTACLVMGVGMLIPAALPFTAPVALGYVVAGTANGVQSVTNQGIVRARSPERLRGRAFAAAGAVLVGANVLGTVLGGAVVALLGARETFAVAGFATPCAGLAALLALQAVGTTKTAPVS